MESKSHHVSFEGAQVKKKNKERDTRWALVKEIPNTSLLVSLHHAFYSSAKLELFEISQKGRSKSVGLFEEISGSKINYSASTKSHDLFLAIKFHFDLGHSHTNNRLF